MCSRGWLWQDDELDELVSVTEGRGVGGLGVGAGVLTQVWVVQFSAEFQHVLLGVRLGAGG